MARMARVIASGIPHHVTQRGNRRQQTFFCDDDGYLLAAARYVEMNPVAAALVAQPGEYPWSSAHAHLTGEDDPLVKVAPLLAMVDNWRQFLSLSEENEMDLLHRHERTGRPLGNEAFVDRLEESLARPLRPQKRGPKLKAE